MKALVTGDRGFVGRHFVDFLKERDWEVYGLDIKTSPDEDVIPYFMSDDDEHFELVVHCAYEVGGRAHIDGKNMALANNLLMDSSMFNWALKGGANAVLYFSSSAAYPIDYQRNTYHQRLHEGLIYLDEVKQPDSNYGWAKLTGERLARNAQELGLRVHVVRPFSGYGFDQGLEYPFPSIVKRALAGTLEVWGPAGQTRDWIHISDVIEGAYEIYKQDVRTPVNLCTGIPTEMGVLMMKAFYMANGMNYETFHTLDVNYLEDKPTGVFYRVGDPKKMLQYYQPRISLEDGIREAIDKFKGV